MSCLLIAWELGGAYGHFARCLQLTRALQGQGHRVVLVMKELRFPAGLDLPQDVTVLQCPSTPARHRMRGMPVNYADVLRRCGFLQPDEVGARLRAWHTLFTLTRPDGLIADYAPTAVLAAQLAGLPHLSIGNGFAIPPDTHPWPSIRIAEEVSEERLRSAEQRLDSVVEQAVISLGYRDPVRIRELYGSADVLDTFAELDHYGERMHGCYVGPLVSLPGAHRLAWPGQKRPRILAYLRPEMGGFSVLLSALRRMDAQVLCVCPGLSDEAARRLATKRLRIVLRPVDLPVLLEEADLAVCYGGSGFVMQALLAGVPLLIRPWQVEQAMFSQRVVAIGAGTLLAPHADLEETTALLEQTMANQALRMAAQDFSERYRDFSLDKAMARATAMVREKLLAVNG